VAETDELGGFIIVPITAIGIMFGIRRMLRF
jgi:hypothetical protein